MTGPAVVALDDLQLDCRPADRMVPSSRNYEAMQTIAAEFQARAIQMVTLLQVRALMGMKKIVIAELVAAG